MDHYCDRVPGLCGHTATLVSNMMIVIGGKRAAYSLNQDIFALDLESKVWTKLLCAGESPRSRAYHTSTLYGWKLFVFGGLTGVGLDDIHYNNYNVFVHPDCLDHAAAKCRGKERLREPLKLRRVTQQRLEGQYLHCLHLEDAPSWTTITTYGAVPPNRSSHSASIYRDNLYIYGGYSTHTTGHIMDEERQAMYSVSKLDLLSKMWTTIESYSPAIMRFGMTGVTFANYWVQFGGTDVVNQEETGVVSVFNFEESTWRDSAGFPFGGRSLHTAVRYADTMYVFGGCNCISSQLFGDINTLDLLTGVWTTRPVTGTPPPALFAHTACVTGEKMIVFGGMDSSFKYNSSTFVLDLSSFEWTKLTSAFHEMYLDNVRGIPSVTQARLGQTLPHHRGNHYVVSEGVQTNDGAAGYEHEHMITALRAKTDESTEAVKESQKRLEASVDAALQVASSRNVITTASYRAQGQVEDRLVHREMDARIQRVKDLIQTAGQKSGVADQATAYWQKELNSLAAENSTWRHVGSTNKHSDDTLFTAQYITPTFSGVLPSNEIFSPTKIPFSKAGYVSQVF